MLDVANVTVRRADSEQPALVAEGLPGLAERSHRPGSCPHQVAGELEVVVAEMRRKHPKWGAKRIRLELLRRPPRGLVVPSERTGVLNWEDTARGDRRNDC